MRHNKVVVTTYGTSERGAGPLLFVETGRGGAADEAIFLLCEDLPAGRRVFAEALGQHKRGDRIRTPEQYVQLITEISVSCGELLKDASVSFAAAFIRGEEFWWAAAGRFSISRVSAAGETTHMEGGWGAGRLETGDKLIGGEHNVVAGLCEGRGELTRSEEKGMGAAGAVVAELRGVAVPRGAGLRVKAPTRRAIRLRLANLSPFGWISLVGVVAVIVVLLATALPSLRKARPSGRADEPKLPESGASQPVGTTHSKSQTSGEFALTLAWKKKFQGPVTSSPVVQDGKVYFGCRDGGLYCLDALSGEQVWKFAPGTGIGASPAVSGDGIFVGGYNGSFWRVDSGTGQKVWEFKTGGKIVSSASVISGCVLFGSYDRNLYCVSAKDGRPRWTYKAAGVVWSSPFVDKARVFFGSIDGTFYCLSLDSGKLLWKYAAGGPLYSSPAVSEGVVCFGSDGRALHFLDASAGNELFRVETLRDVRASAAMSGETAYAASDDGVVRCINVRERAVRWTFKTQRAVRSTPRLSEGILYVTSYDGRLHALEASSGKQLASFDTGAEIYSSPAVSGTMVYFGSNNGSFYCLQGVTR